MTLVSDTCLSAPTVSLSTFCTQGSYPAEYKVNPVVKKGRPVPLNPDHTHFILIDTGRKGEPAYGGEIVMRSMIEEALAAPQEGMCAVLRNVGFHGQGFCHTRESEQKLLLN